MQASQKKDSRIQTPFNNTWPLAVKRIGDFGIAFLGLLCLAPVLGIVALLIRLDSPGPVLFYQWRVGFRGEWFRILKFRTMVSNADEILGHYLEGNPMQRLNWEQFQKLWEDPRLTRVGRFLRKYSLDELPQLWNIIKGEMSLVGPRPFFPEQCQAYGPAYACYIRVRPGLTGLWQVMGRNHTSFIERANWDVYYISHWSLRLDIDILIKTIRVVLSGNGAF